MTEWEERFFHRTGGCSLFRPCATVQSMRWILSTAHRMREDVGLRRNDLNLDLLQMKEAGYMAQRYAGI